jgi:uncharacterized protein YidB (DUF937 family)
MGLIEEFGERAVLGMLGNSSSPLATSVLQVINQHPGGLAGLVRSFHEKGLGELASSWVGTGQNLPISADQLQSVLGSERVKQLAAKVGISPEVAASELSQLLPIVVDKLTPHGQVPAA